jgi:formamidopyrimidine-DNA glycosylase
MLVSEMPELPDITVYIEALERRILGAPLLGARIKSPFLLRTVEPRMAAFEGRRVEGVRRLGKRIVIGFEGDLWLVLHLMIAGRLHWDEAGAKLPGKRGLAAFDFPEGTLILTEAGSHKRASLHLLRGAAALSEHDPGGLEVLESDRTAFAAALTRANHTLKRALTDPRLFSGIGNAYSDEILHRARLSPVAMTLKLNAEEVARLFEAVRSTLIDWTERLRAETGDGFPEKVTAFRAGMAVHGRYGQPCPDCGAAVQRIRYAKNETNYCAHCQTGGKLLADRALSRLLKKDWPKTLEELERLGRGSADP